jgi:hypothetical protein
LDLSPHLLISAVDETARAVLPPRRGDDYPGARRDPAVARLAERLYAVPGETWREALGEWPATGFFATAVAKRLLATEAPSAAEALRRGLVDLTTPESWIFRAARDAAFPAAFALGYAYGKLAATSASPASDGPAG